MNKELTFDQLPIKFRFLIRLLTFSFFAATTWTLSVNGWHSVPHILVSSTLFALSLYFLAGSLILALSLILTFGGRALGYSVALARHLARTCT